MLKINEGSFFNFQAINKNAVAAEYGWTILGWISRRWNVGMWNGLG